ncbi:sensor histidine kinase [Salinispora tropica]|uniref:histidine kinase n=1 Tax=Salinispora tropica (strain ATCC BAA-916 / DSM 44818 / JCM 13857 / NBRC 105044 / CNB-440) TaxID=369723 RepID=A4XBJ8_SALTO|nr:sensor histidine kinase [Salinispora tropica]ABP56305.1 ATP-binding region, ATPase domain protein domain protein [Salinispora tropica CNB-440]
MSTGPTTLPASGDIDQPKRRWLPRLRNARIRSKLALILVVPVTAVIALATVRLITVGEGAYDVTRAKALTELSIDISALAQDLHAERMAAAVYIASTEETEAAADAYNLRVRSTDERVQAYQEERELFDELPAAVSDRVAAIDGHLETLDATRQQVLDRRQMAVAESALRYGVILADLVAYGDGLAQLPGDERLADARRAVAAFARAKAAVGEEESVAYTALSAGRFDEEQYSSFVATLTSQQEALLAFSLAADPRQRSLVDNTVSGDSVTLADTVAADITRSVGQQSLVSAQDASAAIGAVHDLMRWTEARLQEQLLADTEQDRSEVLRQAFIESLLVLMTLVIAVTLAVVLARSLNHSLYRLREGALAVANHDLPDAVRRLQSMEAVDEGGVDDIVREIRDPIRLTNQDEVGQVAVAFNVVHREAVRVAAEQAALRTSVSAMFLNLARRSQTLVDRMIGELDAIERGEEDPKRLARLFELDHLATRMRRNDENLLVLAGADSTVPRREDALLVDVLRAAQSEVELYNRIEFGTVDTDVSVAAHVVNDVVRLVAELLDNATRFSPPNTTVVADGRRIRDYVLIQVEDRGLGLSDEQLDSLNRRLAESSSVDVAAFRLMGLAVVSRLAERHGIRVELRRNVEGGIVAQVTLPTAAVVLPVGRGPAQLTRPRQPLAVEQGPSTSVGIGDPAAGATRAATLPDQRQPEPAPWQAPVQAGTSVAPIQAGGVAGTEPSLSAAGRPGDAPTAAYPLPQRNPSGESSVATAAFPTVAATPPPSANPPSANPLPADSGLTGGLGADLAATASIDATPLSAPPAEAPIFREMEAVWFRTHGNDATAIFTRPDFDGTPPGPSATPGSPAQPHLPTRVPGTTTTPPAATPVPSYSAAPTSPAAPPSAGPPPTAPPSAGPPPTAPPTSVPPASPSASGAPAGGGNAWRTIADEGWSRASQAAEPASGGTTRSGLPKRVPKAQLVPGGIEPQTRERTRRTPDNVRGLLSAYHRGVQRGRAAGSDPNSTSSKETS